MILFRSGEFLFGHVLTEKIGYLSALILDPGKVEFEVGRGVEELVEVREGFTPIAGDNIERGFAAGVVGGEGRSVFEEDFNDFGTAHEGGNVKGGVAVAIGFFEVGFLCEKEGDEGWFSVEGGACEGSHSIFLMMSVDRGTEVEDPFDAGKAAALDGIFEVVAELLGALLEGFGNVFGFIGDVEDEVVAEEPLVTLNLEEVKAVGRKGFEFDGDGFGFTLFESGWNTASVDDDVGICGDVAGVDGHRFFPVGEDGKVLPTTLFMERAEGPEGGLEEGEASACSVTGGEGAEEGAIAGELEKLIAGEAAAVAIDLNVVVVLELKSEGGGFRLIEEEGINLKDDGSLFGGGFEGGEEILGEGVGDGFFVESELTGKGTRVPGAAFEDHFPDGIKAWVTSPGESPELFFGNAFFRNSAVEIKVDDIESALGEDEEAVVSAAPGGRVHA